MTTEQIVLLGVVASAITLFLKALASYAKYKPGRLVINIVLYVVAAAFAVFWTHPALPPFDSNIGAYLIALFQIASPVVGFAALIYNALYEKVVVPTFNLLKKK